MASIQSSIQCSACEKVSMAKYLEVLQKIRRRMGPHLKTAWRGIYTYGLPIQESCPLHRRFTTEELSIHTVDHFSPPQFPPPIHPLDSSRLLLRAVLWSPIKHLTQPVPICRWTTPSTDLRSRLSSCAFWRSPVCDHCPHWITPSIYIVWYVYISYHIYLVYTKHMWYDKYIYRTIYI